MQRRPHCHANMSGSQLLTGIAGDYSFAIIAERSQVMIYPYCPAALLIGYDIEQDCECSFCCISSRVQVKGPVYTHSCVQPSDSQRSMMPYT